MKQVLQALRTGEIDVAEVPCPGVRGGHLLVQTRASLISPGTERSIVEFGQAGLIGKARAQPEKVRQVLDKIRTDGLLPTMEAVFSRLDEPLPLGYCNAGRVVEVGSDVQEFSVGDRVVSNGPHAEVVCAPSTLAARIPQGVTDECATFAVPGAIALHAIRLAQPTLGEHFVVVGLGLVGLLTVQLLRAHGCYVVGIDPNPDRCRLADELTGQGSSLPEGADPVEAVMVRTGGRGADGVLIAASATTDEIVHQAAQMCRKRGRIVLIGVVGLNLRRSDFYAKELSFQVSCSYGPGRYDPSYEQQARDYPVSYVRWTAARNFSAVLDAMAGGRLLVEPLISQRVRQQDAQEAYRALVHERDKLGVVLTYPQAPMTRSRNVVVSERAGIHEGTDFAPAEPVVGVVGAGNFAKRVLLPAIQATGARIHAVCSATGVTGLHAARRFGAERATTDYTELLDSEDVNVVFIATRHNTHAAMAAEALRAGKHVFVEKPVAIDEAGLEQVLNAYRGSRGLQLMVGMNRRFAPHTEAVRRWLEGRSQPIAIDVMVNAGALPADHWLHDPAVGGGRIVGEGCHFVDLAMHLVGHAITGVHAASFGSQGGPQPDDKMSITLTFADGSMATVRYWSNGPATFPKERVEVFSEGRALAIDNWRRIQPYNWPGARKMRMRQDKGHRAEVAAFLEQVRAGGSPLIPVDEVDLTMRATFAAVRSAREGVVITMGSSDVSAPVPSARAAVSAVT